MIACDELNAVSVSPAQIETALPFHLRSSPTAKALALQAYARAGYEQDATSLALRARVMALTKWIAAHETERQFAEHSVLEAAARFPLSETETGSGFEPVGFQELILFIEDLPW